jgi:hypothetical protein
MKKRSCLRWGVGAGILAALLLCVVIVAAFYFQRRSVAFNSRPLVLIHAPINHDRVAVGEGIPVHATAREDSGLRRIELWVDDELVAARDAPEGGATTLTLSHGWYARLEGTHLVVVRALSRRGASGQASVTVTASASSDVGPETHTIQEGETVEVIAAARGVTPEELAAANPDIGSAGPGDELVIPEEEAAAPPATGVGGEAPADSTASPGSSNPLEDLLFHFVPLLASSQGSSEPASLRVEVLSLQTSQAFDGLHCYVGLAGATPRWLPDTDSDQTTDESFAALPGGGWDVQPVMAGAAAPFLSWPGDQMLQLDISCIGMTGGGEDALELGRIQIGIPQADWDGVSRMVGSDGEGGHVDIEYKVTRMSGTPRGVPAWLEPGMTPPTHVHLDDRRISLRWDYLPRQDEEPIDGFRIYLNGSLQWTEPAEARESGLPYEWFHPLCGSPYVFGVTAFRSGYPDGPESPAANAIVVTPVGECNREIQVIFHSLETFELGGDGSPDELAGDVGPVYGYFYANEDEVRFDTRPSGEGGGSLDMPIGLSDYTLYQLNDLFVNRDWNFSMMPGTVVDIPPGGSFEFGFFIMDHDRSRDEALCGADSMAYSDNPATTDLNEWHEGTLTSDDGKCRLSFSWGPAMDSPVGTGIAGGEPLPWLETEDFRVDEATGAVQVQLRNTGTATWPWKDLDVELRTRQGDTVLLQTWDNFALEVGQERTLDFPAGTAIAPFDVCVMLDPGNKVLELYERTGALSHGPQCQQLPDLSIAGVAYDGAGKLRVTVENVGDGALQNRTVILRVSGSSTINGTTLERSQQWPGITLGAGEARVLDFDDFASLRGELRDGYTVQLDPEGTLAEAGVANNRYAVGPGSGYLQLYWASVEAPYDARRDIEYTLQADAVSGEFRRPIVSWHIGQHIDWGSCFGPRYCVLSFTDFEYFQPHFELLGDEALQVTITASDAGEDGDVIGVETYGAGDGWGAGPSGPLRSCSQLGLDPNPGLHQWLMGYSEGHPWHIQYHICREGP